MIEKRNHRNSPSPYIRIDLLVNMHAALLGVQIISFSVTIRRNLRSRVFFFNRMISFVFVVIALLIYYCSWILWSSRRKKRRRRWMRFLRKINSMGNIFVFFFVDFNKYIDIDVVDDVVLIYVPSSYDDRLVLVGQLLDHSVVEECGMHRLEFCPHLSS